MKNGRWKDNPETLATLLRRHYHKQMTAHVRRILMTSLVGTLAVSPVPRRPTTRALEFARHFEPDSADLLDKARAAQRRFERVRRDHLPQTFGHSGPCDLRIGRYCFTFDDREAAWVPPPEPAPVVIERNHLIALLDSVAARLPTDAWIAIQRVRYLTESDEVQRALDGLADCRAGAPWLCDALRGYALHMLERYVDAEAAFARSLDQMDDEQRCEWEDLSELLTGDLRGRYRKLACSERSSLQQSILLLADPLYQIPGNEMWTEHLARHVVSLMHQNARDVDGERWHRDDDRILLRYGWPTGWERVRPQSATAIRPAITTHYGTDGSKFFMPTDEWVSDFPALDSEEWDLDPSRPQSNHNPAYAEHGFEPVTIDVALFKEHDSVLVVTSFTVEDDSIGRDEKLDVALGLLSSLSGAPRLVRDETVGPEGTLWMTASPVPHLMSVETLARPARRAGRWRGGVDLGELHHPGVVASDLLVLEPRDSTPKSARDAVSSVRSAVPFAPGDTFTIYWEVYGLVEPSEVRTTLSLRKTSKGLLRRLVELTPFADAETALSLAWSEVVSPRDGVVGRAITVALPTQASNGQYLLTLSSEAANQRVVRHKRVEIRNN